MTITGVRAVMSINATLAKIIFDNNPGRDFYVEVSFPLDWTIRTVVYIVQIHGRLGRGLRATPTA